MIDFFLLCIYKFKKYSFNMVAMTKSALTTYVYVLHQQLYVVYLYTRFTCVVTKRTFRQDH